MAAHETERALRLCIALLRGLTVQPPRLGGILRPTCAVVPHEAELALRPCNAMLSGQAKESPRLGDVLWPTLAIAAHGAEQALPATAPRVLRNS